MSKILEFQMIVGWRPIASLPLAAGAALIADMNG